MANALSESLQKENKFENKLSVPSVAVPSIQTQESSFPHELKWFIGLLSAARPRRQLGSCLF